MYLIAALSSEIQSLRALTDLAVAGAEDSRAGLGIKLETYAQSFWAIKNCDILADQESQLELSKAGTDLNPVLEDISDRKADWSIISDQRLIKMQDKIRDNVEAFESEWFVTYCLLVDIVCGISHLKASGFNRGGAGYQQHWNYAHCYYRQ